MSQINVYHTLYLPLFTLILFPLHTKMYCFFDIFVIFY